MTKTPTRTHEALRSDETISYGRARSTVEGRSPQAFAGLERVCGW